MTKFFYHPRMREILGITPRGNMFSRFKYFILGVVFTAAIAFSQLPSSGYVAYWQNGTWYYLRADSTLKVDIANKTIGVASVPAPVEAQETWTVSVPTPVFDLAKLPISLKVYRNGQLQTKGVDYQVSGQTVNFLPVSIPQKEDIVQAIYFTVQ
jgi:cytochrome c1